MKEWYSAKEITGLPGMPGTESGTIRKARAEQWRFQDVPGKGGPNGTRREYHLSALPEETRIHLLTSIEGVKRPRGQGAEEKPHLNPGILACPGTVIAGEPSDPAPVNLDDYLASRRITLSPRQLGDPRMQRRLAVARALDLCPAYKGRESLIATLAAQYGVSGITIRRWHDDVEKMMMKSTPRIKLGDERIDLPESHAFTPQALAYGLSTYASNIRAGMKAAYRAMESQAPARDWQLADYVSFTRIVKKVPAAVWTRIKRGPTGFELACVPKIIRQWTAVPVQSVLCGDQKVFDYEVYDEALGRIIIPNGYFWMDCASRMINGVWIEMGHYNSYTVGAALREAMRYGISDEIFTDWGKPEGSKHITHILKALGGISIASDFASMEERYGDMDADGVEHRKAQPGKPWMKPIENIMNILDTRLAEKFLAGFRKRNNDAWVNKVIQSRLKKDRKLTLPAIRPASRMEARGLMNIETFIHTVFTTVEEHNKAVKQLKEGGKIVPWDFYTTRWAAKPPRVLADQTLDYICMPYAEIMPRQSVVNFQARSNDYRGYYSSALASIKHKVRVSYNPYDPAAVAVLTDIESGDIIDIGQPWHSQNPHDRAGTSEKIHRQAELKKWVEVQAKRLKEGFDLAIEDLQPHAAPIAAIGPASTVAKEAAAAQRIYEIRHDNEKLVDKDHAKLAASGMKDLLADLHGAGSEFIVPTQSKERYRLWCILDLERKKGRVLSEPQQDFLAYYCRDVEWKVHREMHEESGEDYIDLGIKPEILQVVK
jgi:transposase InsO family protein